MKNREIIDKFEEYFWNCNEEILTMKISIENLFSDSRKFTIPEYQRKYIWKTRHAENLFLDSIDFYEKQIEPLFIGVILVSGGNNNKFEIMDGQQRLISIMIMLLVMRKKIYSSENIKPNKKNELLSEIESLVSRSRSTSTFPSVISLRDENDNNYIKSIFDYEDISPEDDNDLSRVIILFEKLFDTYEIESKFEESLKAIKNIELSIVKIPNYENEGNSFNPYFAFEAINSKGIPLKISQLLRNYLYSLNSKLTTDNKKEIHLYQERFDRIKEFLDKISNEYSSENEINIWQTQFLAFYDGKIWNEFSGEAKARKLPDDELRMFELIKHVLNNEENLTKSFISLEKMIVSYEIYKNEMIRIRGNFQDEPNPNLKQIMEFVFNVKEVRPILINWLDNENFFNYVEGKVEWKPKFLKQNGYFFRKMKFLEKLIITFHIVKEKHFSISQKNTQYKKFINEVWDIDIDLWKYLSDNIHEWKEKRKTKHSLIFAKDELKKNNFMDYNFKSYSLKALENILSDKKIFPDGTNKKKGEIKFTIEHIQPISPSPEDKEEIVRLYECASWEEYFEKYLHNIGNLTIAYDNNENLIFKNKKDYFVNSDIKIDLNLSSCSDFDIKEFEQRQEKIIELFLNNFFLIE